MAEKGPVKQVKLPKKAGKTPPAPLRRETGEGVPKK